MKRPAVFLDRDGTINEQMGYINHITRFKLLPGVRRGVQALNEKGFLTIVVSNQSGVARGFFPIDLVEQVNSRMKHLMAERGARLDAIYYCPHHPHGSVDAYSIPCKCRKPRTGLLEKACQDFQIDLRNSFVIGDTSTDIVMASRFGLKGILVKTGYGLGEAEYVLPTIDVKPIHIADDLLDAAMWILNSS